LEYAKIEGSEYIDCFEGEKTGMPMERELWYLWSVWIKAVVPLWLKCLGYKGNKLVEETDESGLLFINSNIIIIVNKMKIRK